MAGEKQSSKIPLSPRSKRKMKNETFSLFREPENKYNLNSGKNLKRHKNGRQPLADITQSFRNSGKQSREHSVIVQSELISESSFRGDSSPDNILQPVKNLKESFQEPAKSTAPKPENASTHFRITVFYISFLES